MTPIARWRSTAASHGSTGAARALLEAGADANTRDGGRHGIPALYAVTGHREAPRIARLLLEAGADPDDGESAFHAAERFHVEALELLLEYGVDLNHVGDWGEAASRGRFDAVHACLAAGFPVGTAGEDGATALHHAAIRGHAATVRELLARGADAGLVDPSTTRRRWAGPSSAATRRSSPVATTTRASPR